MSSPRHSSAQREPSGEAAPLVVRPILVSDACLGVKWFVPEPGAESTARLLDGRFELRIFSQKQRVYCSEKLLLTARSQRQRVQALSDSSERFRSPFMQPKRCWGQRSRAVYVTGAPFTTVCTRCWLFLSAGKWLPPTAGFTTVCAAGHSTNRWCGSPTRSEFRASQRHCRRCSQAAEKRDP